MEVERENGMTICVGVCYRSPTASAQENEILLEVINNVAKSKVLLLMGDFQLSIDRLGVCRIQVEQVRNF